MEQKLNSQKLLGIETQLEMEGAIFFNKYIVMKERLLTTEYEHWAAGFPEGNNHGPSHIRRVLVKLDQILDSNKQKHINCYELFLAMMSILYHDIGIMRQRQDHGIISKNILNSDINDAYIIDPFDKEIISAAVVSHSGSKSIETECQCFSQEETIKDYKVRPKVIAALVRLADELDEDSRRADLKLQERLNIPESSLFFWRFCQRIQGIMPIFSNKKIQFDIKLLSEDIELEGLTPNGKRFFTDFFAEKLDKFNKERILANLFLPYELKYSEILINMKPITDFDTWKTPRNFVFYDHTKIDDFFKMFPELFPHRYQSNKITASFKQIENIDNNNFAVPISSILTLDNEKHVNDAIDLYIRRISYNERISPEFIKFFLSSEKYSVRSLNELASKCSVSQNPLHIFIHTRCNNKVVGIMKLMYLCEINSYFIAYYATEVNEFCDAISILNSIIDFIGVNLRKSECIYYEICDDEEFPSKSIAKKRLFKHYAHSRNFKAKLIVNNYLQPEISAFDEGFEEPTKASLYGLANDSNAFNKHNPQTIVNTIFKQIYADSFYNVDPEHYEDYLEYLELIKLMITYDENKK